MKIKLITFNDTETLNGHLIKTEPWSLLLRYTPNSRLPYIQSLYLCILYVVFLSYFTLFQQSLLSYFAFEIWSLNLQLYKMGKLKIKTIFNNFCVSSNDKDIIYFLTFSTWLQKKSGSSRIRGESHLLLIGDPGNMIFLLLLIKLVQSEISYFWKSTSFLKHIK